MRAITIVLANHKGGCGKTTTTANLGVAFAARSRRVLLIDADPQANLTEAFGHDPTSGLAHALTDPAAAVIHRGLPRDAHLIPCAADLEAAVAAGANQPGFALRLRDLVHHLAPEYDAILIDTPPGLGPLSSMAMLAADYVLVPARPADFDVTGAVKLAALIRTYLAQLNPSLHLLGVLLTQVDRRWRLGHDARRALDAAGIRRLRTEIPFRVRVGHAPRHGAPTTALEPDGAIGAAYDLLASDLIRTVLAR
jgi:chromosome partitioning protein